MSPELFPLCRAAVWDIIVFSLSRYGLSRMQVLLKKGTLPFHYGPNIQGLLRMLSSRLTCVVQHSQPLQHTINEHTAMSINKAPWLQLLGVIA